MDVVLEVTDTFIADYVYAYLFPLKTALYDFPTTAVANSSAEAFSSWTYQPASQYLTLEPHAAAYMSSMARDNIIRQGATLFFITWYVESGKR
jgi:lathosterol oxidase